MSSYLTGFLRDLQRVFHGESGIVSSSLSDRLEIQLRSSEELQSSVKYKE